MTIKRKISIALEEAYEKIKELIPVDHPMDLPVSAAHIMYIREILFEVSNQEVSNYLKKCLGIDEEEHAGLYYWGKENSLQYFLEVVKAALQIARKEDAEKNTTVDEVNQLIKE